MNRGMDYFLTCDVRDVALWETRLGPRQTSPKSSHTLAPGLSHSYHAQARRQEIGDNWRAFLDALEPLLLQAEGVGAHRLPPLPAQAVWRVEHPCPTSGQARHPRPL